MGQTPKGVPGQVQLGGGTLPGQDGGVPAGLATQVGYPPARSGWGDTLLGGYPGRVPLPLGPS